MYDYSKLRKDINNTGVGVLELSDTIKDNIRESFNTHSLKELITRYGNLFLNTNSGNIDIDEEVDNLLAWPYKNDYEYDSTIIPKIKEKIIDINKTIEGKDITYSQNRHNLENPDDISLWNFYGAYEKLTILRKWLVDNYKKSIYQMWYEIPLQNNKNPSGVDVTKIHQELTKIYLELYGHLEEVQNFGREYNPNETIQQTFRIQVYEEGCFIEPHFDGNAPDGHCVLLVYTNEDYVEGKGGELVSEYKPGLNRDVETITVPPTIGTLVVVDLKNDPYHAVNVVKEKDWMRTVIGSWWPAQVSY